MLARTAVVLLLVSAGRFAWEARRGPPLLPEVRNDLPGLLAETRRLQEEDELRGRLLGPGERVDPNRAPEAELDRLPGVGRGTARAIVEARELGGGFAFAEDLLRVRGIGPATLERVAALPGSHAPAPDRRSGGHRCTDRPSGNRPPGGRAGSRVSAVGGGGAGRPERCGRGRARGAPGDRPDAGAAHPGGTGRAGRLPQCRGAARGLGDRTGNTGPSPAPDPDRRPVTGGLRESFIPL